METVTALRQDSYSLKFDQNSKLNAISATLTELASATESLRNEVSISQSIGGSSSLEPSPGDYRHILKDTQSALLSSTRIDALSSEISQLALTEHEIEEIAKEQTILKSLNFPSRPVRHENISESYKETFQWVINPDEDFEEAAGEQFRDWLRFGDKIFWFSGKAGSGKSTLMKFLADHEETRETLQEWANGSQLVIASHYFWSAGTPMQKSYEGLFRTLLYDIFRLCPVLIRQVCPDRWAQGDSSRTEKDWTVTELLGTLKTISEHSDLRGQYCFFIDGLDEYDGDHIQLCKTMKELSSSSHIKFCLASRPWNAFVDAFGEAVNQKMCLEDLTRRDILQYTKSRLAEHEKWNTSQFREDQKQSIIDNITEKAHGVFLWVFLVTRSLREGLTNGDTILDLRNRLENLPTDLERFFKHMLEVVDPVYHKKMASFLSIAINGNAPLVPLIYSMHEHEYEDVDYAINMQVSPMKQSDRDMLLSETRRRINARCGGLLEVKYSSVEWLHRTVRDFLFTHEMNDYLKSKVGCGFSANLSTLKAYVAALKRSDALWDTVDKGLRERGLLWECLKFATEALEEFEDSAFELLDTLESVYISLDDRLGIEFSQAVLRVGVDKYILYKLRESSQYFDHSFRPPLSVVLEHSPWTTRHLRTIRNLLEFEQDPNEEYAPMQHLSVHRQALEWEQDIITDSNYSKVSNWTSFLQRTCHDGCQDNFQNAMDIGLFELFLQSGARRHVVIEGAPARYTGEADSMQVRDGFELKAITTDQIYRTIRLWNETRIPCALFVQALFSQHEIPKNPDRYLAILDDLSDSSIDKQLYSSVLYTLDKELAEIGSKGTRLGKLKFTAQITERIITHGAVFGCSMYFLKAVISKVFPNSLRSRILHIITTGHPPEIGHNFSSKRHAEDDLSDRVNKRSHRVPA